MGGEKPPTRMPFFLKESTNIRWCEISPSPRCSLVHAHKSILEKISRSTSKGALILEDVFFVFLTKDFLGVI